MHENEISAQILDAAIKVHSVLGPGLLESVYMKALAYELRKRGLKVELEVPIYLNYEGVDLGKAFVADAIVEDKVIIEGKAIEDVPKVLKKKLLTYIRLAKKRLGVLINFGAELIKQGYTRVVDGLEE